MELFAWILLGVCVFEVLFAPSVVGKTVTKTVSYVIVNTMFFIIFGTFMVFYLFG